MSCADSRTILCESPVDLEIHWINLALAQRSLQRFAKMVLPRFYQSPRDPDFVQNPYPAYDRARALGPLVYWEEYDLPATTTHALTDAILRDRRFGREVPAELRAEIPAHLEPFYALERHSMLEREPPEHTRLRGQVLRAFTARRVASLGPGIAALSETLIAKFPKGPFDLLTAFAETLPVTIIARMLGVDEARAPDLLAWSHAMVAMYQARRDRTVEDNAVTAATAFKAFIIAEIDQRRRAPGNDLLSALATAEDGRLSDDEIAATAILLLNAGHEATVHVIGNGVAAILASKTNAADFLTDSAAAETLAEEAMRYDPPLHMFKRMAYETVEIAGHRFERGDEVALLLGAANRDPAVWDDAHRFDPKRAKHTHLALGAGIHFCVGAPLARLELATALPILLARCPNLALTEPPKVADRYHFHGFERLMVTT